MRISISNAADRLSELVRLAQQGEDVVLTTEDGTDAVRLEAAWNFVTDPDERLKRIALIQELAGRKGLPPETDAARSQDFLYDDDGLPA